MKELRNRWTAHLKDRKKTFLVGFLFLVSSFLFILSSSVMAALWNPEDLLKKYLKENYPWAEVQMDDVVWNGIMPENPPERIMVEKRLPGKALFLLEFEGGKKITAAATIKAFDRIVVSRGAFKKGYCLRKDDVYLTLMDVQRIPDGTVKDIDQVVGKPLTRSVIANMQLTSGMVSETPIVKRGQKVTLLVESENFKITAPGEIKANSSVGRAVKAVNLASKKIVTGLLIDENTVKVGL